jgi:hydrogenase-4 component F
LFAGFGLTTLAGPLMNSIGLYWIAIELTTLVSTFLVAFERIAESIEAAWKYIMVVSAGISLALLGTVLLYWGGSFVLGPRYNMTWSALAGAAPHMNPVILLLGFLLVLVGYGTKVGLAPMHTWLPDAHSEAPAPVSAMLSGALLNTAMIGIARFLAVARSADLGILPQMVVVVFGALSLLVGALFIVRQRGIKRLMAYSSVEHMGVVAIGLGFGGTLGIVGALYHMLNHSLNKSLMFFGAGNVMRAYDSKAIGAIKGVGNIFGTTGPLWLAGAIAITGAPPFGLFFSEFTIMRAGFTPHFAWAVYLMAILLIVIFVGFMNHFRAMYYGGEPNVAPRVRLSGWCATPMWLALIPLLVLGLWWPAGVWDYLTSAAHLLLPGSR